MIGRCSRGTCAAYVFVGGAAVYLHSPQNIRRARRALIHLNIDRAPVMRSCERCQFERATLSDSPAYLLAQPHGALVSLRRGDGLRYLCSPEAAESFVLLYGIDRLGAIFKRNAMPPWTWYRDHMAIIAAADCTLTEGHYLTLGSTEVGASDA